MTTCERCGEVNPAEIHTCTPNEFNPDWSVMAVMVEEQQRMAKRIEELEAQLAQQEPVAIVTSDLDGGNKSIKFLNDVAYMNLMQKTLLYTAPLQREWQGLTDEEMFNCLAQTDGEAKRLPLGFKWFAEAIEAKLKEKNA